MPNAMVILPTYNEADNLETLVQEILSLDLSLKIVIIDDNSPDGTGEIADKLSHQYRQVKAIHRKGRRGRGLAGVEGFKFALREGADYILEMDADFSHQPKYISQLLKEIEDCDCVIGSRYVAGGGESGRPLNRRIISRVANLYLVVILGRGVRDWSSGYRCFRREVLESIPWPDIRSEGPSIVQEVLYLALLRGYRVKETPIIFQERWRGSSKLRPGMLLSSLILPLKLRWRRK